jgi:hypothetical protein
MFARIKKFFSSRLKAQGSKLKVEKLRDKSTKLDIENMKFKADNQKRVKSERQIKSFGFENLEVWDRSVDFGLELLILLNLLILHANILDSLNKLKPPVPQFQ